MNWVDLGEKKEREENVFKRLAVRKFAFLKKKLTESLFLI